MCLVTIGLPVYNNAPFLADAVQSVINQTLTDWELLIVDDGSTDNSLAIAQSFTDPRIRVLTDGVNWGLPARLNQVAQLANGHYLARMDGDDIMIPDRLRTQVNCMAANPAIDVVGAFAYTIDTQNRVYGVRGTTTLPGTRNQAAARSALIHPTVLARTGWFRAYPYNEDCRRAEDVDLWLRTIETATFHVVAQPLLFYRELGLPQLENYVQTARDFRAILRRSGPTMLSPYRSRQLLLQSYGKEMIYKLCARVGQIDWLLRRRNRRLTGEEQQQAQALLDQVYQIK